MAESKKDKSWDPQYDSVWQLGRQHGFKQGVAVGVGFMLVFGVVIVLLLYAAIMST